MSESHLMLYVQMVNFVCIEVSLGPSWKQQLAWGGLKESETRCANLQLPCLFRMHLALFAHFLTGHEVQKPNSLSLHPMTEHWTVVLQTTLLVVGLLLHRVDNVCRSLILLKETEQFRPCAIVQGGSREERACPAKAFSKPAPALKVNNQQTGHQTFSI